MSRRSYRDRAGVAMLAVVLVVMAVWNVTDDRTFYNDRSSVPSGVDHFLAAVRAATPPHAHLLVADTWVNNVMFVRALTLLQPRRLWLLRVTPSEIKRATLAITWAQLRKRARSVGAQYAIFYAIVAPDPKLMANGWLVPAIPRGAIPPSAVRLRDGNGLLVEVI